MVHFINGADSGDLLFRAEVLPRINKVGQNCSGASATRVIVFREPRFLDSSRSQCHQIFYQLTIINYLNYSILNFSYTKSYGFIYSPASYRELQRIESISSNPVISHFSETILGLTTIRAYNQESRFMEMLFKRMEDNNVAFVILNCSNRWLGIALVFKIWLCR